MNKDVKSLIEEIQKFDVTEYTEDDNVIDNDTINNIIFNDLPNFPGSDEIKAWLSSYNWEDRTDIKKFKWKEETVKVINTVAPNITNLLYTETFRRDPKTSLWEPEPLKMLLPIIEKLKEEWPQYQNDWRKLKNEKYCCISYYGGYEFRIFEYNGPDESQKLPRACIIRPYSLVNRGKYAVTITLYSDLRGFYRNTGYMAHAPIELFDLFYKFAKRYSSKNKINENLNRFDVSEYNDEEDTLIGNHRTADILFNDLPKFPGSEQLKSFLLKYDWNNIKDTPESYRYTNFMGDDKVITNLLSADTSSEYPLDEFIDLFKELGENVWEQYTNIYDLSDKEYCIIKRNGNYDITITQHFNFNKIYGKSCYIKDWYINGKKGRRVTLYVYDISLNYDTPRFSDIYAPIELYDFLKKFAEHIYPKESINEDINNFNVSDYNDDSNSLIDTNDVDNIVYNNFPKFKGSDVLLNKFNEIDWKKLPKHYEGIYTSDLTVQDGFSMLIQWFSYFAVKDENDNNCTSVSIYHNIRLNEYQMGVCLYKDHNPDYSHPSIMLGPLKSLKNNEYCICYRLTFSMPPYTQFIERRYLNKGFYDLLSKFIDMHL